MTSYILILLEHIFEGEINGRGRATGYHYEMIEDSAGSVIEGTRTMADPNGVYEGKVTVNGVPKTANGGKSTFFPESMTPQEVVDCINEAYGNKIPQLGTVNTYNGTTSQGFTVQMFLDAAGKIKSAFPLGTGGH